MSALFLCVGFNTNAAVRTPQSPTRQSETSARQTSTAKKTIVKTNANSSRTAISKPAKKTVANTSRAAKKTVVSRSATPTSNVKISTARSGIKQQKNKTARAAATTKTVAFSEPYIACRDAYFSCMDQFCATQNETYRRCVCSSKLKNIQDMEKKLDQTTDSLKDFQDINIDAISKTSAEVKAMGTASEGESAIKKDTSSSATALKNISGVLNETKQKSLQDPIPVNNNAIWGTTDLIGGSDIADLTGEALYNAVHSQCTEIIQDSCSASDLKMVSSAYGVYIENDCALLESALANKKNTANASIRATRHQMQDARLENYNAHNSLSLNDCIAKVREDLTQETACGKDYVHCLDVTGKYLNSTTGDPIYSADFYQLENQISLSGDVLKNSTNSLVLSVLNDKKAFAQKSLDLCTDDSANVWDEFLRQAIVEISQGQLKRIQNVKSECLQVVNDCYLKQTEQLKDFSDNSSDIALGTTLELSEEMCKEKLTTCSNLYGRGADGLEILVNTMKGITDSTIAQTCPDLLDTFITKTCAVSANDSKHTFPYGCRAYAPGEQRYAVNAMCNLATVNPFDRSLISSKNYTSTLSVSTNYNIPTNVTEIYTKTYTYCNFGYYLFSETYCHDITSSECQDWGYTEKGATACHVCPAGYICTGGIQSPSNGENTKLYSTCGETYIGSLYHKLVRYALQNCVRPSNNSGELSETLLGDVDNAMKKVQKQIIEALSTECSDMGGIWVEQPWKDTNADGKFDSNTSYTLYEKFYTTTGANNLWGFCTTPEE